MKGIIKKTIATVFISLVLCLAIFSLAEARTIKVKSYYKPSTGAYVQSYYRTSPNRSKLDNWSTKGNINPYTGKRGYNNPWSW